MPLKTLLANFLPNSARAFHKTAADLSQKLKNIQQTAESQQQTITNLQTDVDNLKTIIANQSKIIKEQKIIVDKLANYSYKKSWRSWKKAASTQNFIDFMQQENYPQIFNNLIANLDEPSRMWLSLILRRTAAAKDVAEGATLHYQLTPHEQQLYDTIDLHHRQSLQIAENIFLVSGFYLPIMHKPVELICFNSIFKQIDNLDFIADKAIIDLGAYIGDTLLPFSQLACTSIHCFEPIKKHFDLLQQTITLNNFSHAVAINKAVGDTPGKIQFERRSVGSRILSTKTQQEQEDLMQKDKIEDDVEIITLDDYVNEFSLKVGLIKADIEGAEQAMLDGAKQTIFKQKPILLLSLYHNAEDFFLMKSKIESWNLGYKFKVVKALPPFNFGNPIFDIMLLAEVNKKGETP
ncbi:MAG: FkbM family methyltransferase [Firmicutes bacterium]|nr:FkbM family methyltransferase [Bacillota bacterium]